MPNVKAASKLIREPEIVNKAKDRPLVMAPEEIAREVHTLSDDLLMTPPQLATIMQTTTDQLQTMRETGDGPTFVKLGDGAKAPVRYPVGQYREWISKHTYSNTSQINVSRFTGFANFMSNGMIDERFVITVDAQGWFGEFWESIQLQKDVVEVRWMRMDDMLEELRRQANLRYEQDKDLDLGQAVQLTSKVRDRTAGHADSI